MPRWNATCRLTQFLTTEHFTLQGLRSGTISEANGRLGHYLSAVGSGVVALAFAADVSFSHYDDLEAVEKTMMPFHPQSGGWRPVLGVEWRAVRHHRREAHPPRSRSRQAAACASS